MAAGAARGITQKRSFSRAGITWQAACLESGIMNRNITRNITANTSGKASRWLNILPVAITLTFALTSGALADGSEDKNSKRESDDKESKSSASGTPSVIQSSARPYGLSIVAPVMQAGSDAASRSFQNVLPGMEKFIQTYLPESHNNMNSPLAFAIDPAKLTLSTKSDVRVYFAYEGAGYRNTLGFNTTGTGVSSGDPEIIFPNVSSSLGYGGSGNGVRTASDPLLAGDFVNLGSFKGGTKLDFFLIADGANGGKTVFSTTESANPDRINHVASFSPSYWGVANSPYLFISYEDLLGGGDKDFNDVVFALDIGAANVAALLATPEPATWLTLGSLVGLAVWARNRNRSQRLALVPSVAQV